MDDLIFPIYYGIEEALVGDDKIKVEQQVEIQGRCSQKISI
jgi:hypothetical protein